MAGVISQGCGGTGTAAKDGGVADGQVNDSPPDSAVEDSGTPTDAGKDGAVDGAPADAGKDGAVEDGAPGDAGPCVDPTSRTWTIFDTSNELPSNDIRALASGNGALWVGTAAGLARYDGSNWTTFSTSDGLPGATITALAFDSSGVLWIGAGADGVASYDGNTFKTISGFPGGTVTALATEAPNTVWVGLQDKGLARSSGGSWTTIDAANSKLPGDGVQALHVTPAGDLWVGTASSGIGVRHSDGSWTLYNIQNVGVGDGFQNVTSFAADAKGDIWVTTGSSGLFRQDGGDWDILYSDNNSLPTNGYLGMALETCGQIWTVTGGAGVVAYAPLTIVPNTVNLQSHGFWQFRTSNSKFPDPDNAASVVHIGLGAIWVGTPSGGLARIQ